MSADETAFPPGTQFRTLRGGRLGTIAEVLGVGGQGAVFAVDLEGRRFALKWYHASYAAVDDALRARLLRAAVRGPPDESFLWPIDLAEIGGNASFGYVMPLRENNFAGMRDLIARPPKRIDPPLATRAAICLNIAESFLQLHSRGFCYQDVNFGNIFFHPANGHVLICDNDNVDVDGEPPSVFGTRKFMAPEIVRREGFPNTRTDLFSMAVLFFYVLHGWHPLDGRREAEISIMDTSAETALYGTHPVFLFDPNDASNGPMPGMHEPIEARWNTLPAPLRTLFIRSFTTGLHQPQTRVLEAEWRAAFAALATGTFACAGCGFEHAVQGGATAPGVPVICAACRAPMRPPAMLAVNRALACLAPGREIPHFIVSPSAPIRLGHAAGVVEAHPSRPGIWGLRNRTDIAWRTTLREGSVVPVPPGSAVRLMDGAKIDFGEASGLVMMPPDLADGRAPQMSGQEKKWFVGGASVRGAAHERRGTANQDAIGWLPREGSGAQIAAAIADGHGAAAHFRSEVGARLAVQSANAVLDWLLADDHSDAAIAELPAQAVAAWQDLVKTHAAAEAAGQPWVESLADLLLPYGATLVALAASETMVLALQIGDGDLYLGYPDGQIRKPLPDDTGLVGEQTYSLCAPDAATRFRSSVIRAAPGVAMPDFAFLATDGISKSFRDEETLRQVVGHYRDVLLTSPMAEINRSLPGWLADLSGRGSGDDATLCLAVRKHA